MANRFAGFFTPIVTPFTAAGDFDERGMAANVARYVASPLTGLVVLGSNGEAALLDDDEADRVIATVRTHLPRNRPLIAGTGRESTRATIAATRRAADLGVDAVLVRTPSFFKSQMSSDVFVRHYTAVADASPLPVILYNVTMYTGVTLQPDAVATLSEHPNIAGLKDSGTDMLLIADYLARAKPGFTVLAGSATTLYSSLALGAHGAVLALAGLVPELCVRLGEHVQAGRFAEARDLQKQLVPLARTIGAGYAVSGLKAALDLLGLAGGPARPPLVPVGPAVVETLRQQLRALGADVAPADGGAEAPPLRDAGARRTHAEVANAAR